MANELTPAFAVGNFRRVQYGRIRLLFDLKIGPITLRDNAIVFGEDEKPKFAAVRRIREKFSDGYISVADVDSKFMRIVFADVIAKLEGNAKPEPAPDPDAWATEQEQRFERAFDELSGAS
jgi:hypothetical protein